MTAPTPGGPPPPVPVVIDVVRPPARRARRLALVLAIIAVAFSIAFGFAARRAYALRETSIDEAMLWTLAALVLLLVAMLLRMGSAIGELIWLERTWSNLPEPLRRVGPVESVSSGLAIAVSFVPGVAWVWKLGLVVGVANGFEAMRERTGFRAPVPRDLGKAAVVVGWVPGLNVYLAPFLWEMFATRVDVIVDEIVASQSAPPATSVPTAIAGSSSTLR